MIKSIDFYFDFISPYSFLAHKRIRKIENEEKIKFIYKPILLGGLHNSQKLLLKLTKKGLSRQEAYSIVQKNAMEAWDNRKNYYKND